MNNLEETICKAIRERRVVKFCYKGLDKIVIVEPFLLGYHKNTNNVVLRAYFIKGHSTSKSKNDWRFYNIEMIEKFELTNNIARTDIKGYDPNDDNVGLVICRV